MSTEPPEQARGMTRYEFDQLVRQVLARRRIPTATYRLQLNRTFRFEDARQIVPYLDRLGVSDVYLSPIFRAGWESAHGYDVVDHNTLNPALGTPDEFDALSSELQARNMGLIFDMVPNHMGIAGSDNAWWRDVLENGPSSPYAPFFDVDWHPLKAGTDLENRVLLPVLGDPYGKALESQELSLEYDEGAFFVRYHHWRMPLEPRSYADVLSARLSWLTEQLGPQHEDLLELQSILTALSYLPLETETDPDKVAERQREKEIVKRRLAKLIARSAPVREAVTETVRAYNGTPGDPHSFDALDALLNRQCYRVAFWRVAAEEINYRRFFDINELAAIRMERPEVFAQTHRLLFELIRQGKVTGLRIDHADGLWDPVGYLRKLQQSAFLALSQDWLERRFGSADERRVAAEQAALEWFETARSMDPKGTLARPLYVVVEKILSRGEHLPDSWPVDGTTGYDFANLANGLFVDASNQKAFTRLYSDFTHTAPTNFGELVNSTKKIIMLVSLASEVNELAYQLKRIASQNRWYRDFTLNSLTHVVREVIAALPVYRTYLTERRTRIEAHDVAAIETAIAEAQRRNPRTAVAVFEFVRKVLLQEYPEGASDAERAAWDYFVMRFQQTTGPVMAKGVEDTAFYVYNRLVSLNEVGGDPEQFGIPPTVFHHRNQERRQRWPHTLLAASTHDSKRSADVRARLNVLSEIPRTWRAALVRWSRWNRTKKSRVDGQLAPDRNEEYLYYQTLVGTWPLENLDERGFQLYRQRIRDYLEKALKEAKIHSSWVNPNHPYDAAVARFVEGTLTGRSDSGFLPDFRQFAEFVSFYGMLNSLAQTLLQLTAPGVPDIYQGNELWDFSLVDPDNRRPVDFRQRMELLDAILADVAAVTSTGSSRASGRSLAPAGRGRPPTSTHSPAPVARTLADVAVDLLRHWRDGRVKLYLIQRALTERRTCPTVFSDGDYWPAEPVGEAKDHLVAFGRSLADRVYLTIVPRLVVGLTRGVPSYPVGETFWGETLVVSPEIEPGQTFENVLTGEAQIARRHDGVGALSIADVLSTFPVALLRRV